MTIAESSPPSTQTDEAPTSDVPAASVAPSEPLDQTAPIIRLLPITAPAESRWIQSIFTLFALLVIAAHVWVVMAHWAPANLGSNQNAYLAAGRQIATTGSPLLKPQGHYDFVGWMWNIVDAEALASTTQSGASTQDAEPTTRTIPLPADAPVPTYYPKYPPGVSLLNAIGYLIGGESDGYRLAHMVSPICSAITLASVFLITRLVGTTLSAALAAALLGGLSAYLVQAGNPYSHPPSVAAVSLGAYLLLSGWSSGKVIRLALAGAVIGSAVWMRYTDGLFGLLIGAFFLCAVRWRVRRSWYVALAPIVSWGVVVGVLAIHNLVLIGSITGYDSTNESTGFTLAEFTRKWEQTLNQLHGTGLYLIFPLAILGLLMAWKWNARVALILWLWLVPTSLLYTSYYWGANLPMWGFLRFFIVVFPAAAIASAWALSQLLRSSGSSIIPPIAATVFVALVVVLHARVATGPLERDHTIAFNTDVAVNHVDVYAPRDAIVFGNSQNLHNVLQARRPDLRLIASDYIVEGRPVPSIRGGPESDEPNPIQPQRMEYVRRLYARDRADARVTWALNEIRSAIARGQTVLMVVSAPGGQGLLGRLRGVDDLAMNEVVRWSDPMKMTDAARRASGGAGPAMTRREPWNWRIYRIDLASKSTTKPTTQSSTDVVD